MTSPKAVASRRGRKGTKDPDRSSTPSPFYQVCPPGSVLDWHSPLKLSSTLRSDLPGRLVTLSRVTLMDMAMPPGDVHGRLQPSTTHSRVSRLNLGGARVSPDSTWSPSRLGQVMFEEANKAAELVPPPLPSPRGQIDTETEGRSRH